MEQLFQINGPKLFNCLPAKLRNMTKINLEDFKMALDKWMEGVTDQPKIDGLTPGKYSNSILQQTKRGAQGGGRSPGT